ncbi:MAG TPA: head GIN domain-containing protein [Dehalococcoidales bacterium]|nr:head GIN domain-containing protein [Dehalococcoidales bacterium]
MNKKVLLVGLIILAVGLVAAACVNFSAVTGTGPQVTRTYEHKDFSEIEISSAIRFDITHAENYSLVMSAPENLVNYLDIKKSGSTLIIRLKPGSYSNSEIRASITTPDLNSLTISGASRGSARGFVSKENLSINCSGASQLEVDIMSGKAIVEISGASKLTGTLSSPDIRFNISGASKADIEGSAERSNLAISGASRFNSPSFKMKDCAVNVTGASNATIYASGTLDIDASGASKVVYSGNPEIRGLKVSGASRVSQ